MTSTSVKDVGMVLQNIAGAKGSATSKENKISSQKESDFSEVLTKQTQQEKTSETTSSKETDNKSDKVSSTGTSKQDTQEVKENADASEMTTKPEDELTLEELEDAMETLQTLAVNFIDQMAEILGVSQEEIMQVMNDFQMETMDILNPQNLNQVMMELSGMEDSIELLTNESLFQNFNTVIQAQKDAISQAKDALGMDETKLQQTITTANDLSMMPSSEEASPLAQAVENVTADMEALQDDETQRAQPKETQTVDNQKVVEEVEIAASKPQPTGKNETASQEGRQSFQEQGNLFAQQLKQTDTNIQTQQVSQNNFSTDFETQDIMRQIMDHMRIQLSPDTSNLEMQLHPASLGTIQVQVASKGGAVTASFITQSESVKAVLESQMVQLQERFTEQGIKVENIEVMVQTQQFEQNQERGQNPETTERRNRVRRLQLSGEDGLEELQQLEEEDELARQVMTMNGGTIDYTA